MCRPGPKGIAILHRSLSDYDSAIRMDLSIWFSLGSPKKLLLVEGLYQIGSWACMWNDILTIN